MEDTIKADNYRQRKHPSWRTSVRARYCNVMPRLTLPRPTNSNTMPQPYEASRTC